MLNANQLNTRARFYSRNHANQKPFQAPRGALSTDSGHVVCVPMRHAGNTRTVRLCVSTRSCLTTGALRLATYQHCLAPSLTYGWV
jgi:hypothetical protein